MKRRGPLSSNTGIWYVGGYYVMCKYPDDLKGKSYLRTTEYHFQIHNTICRLGTILEKFLEEVIYQIEQTQGMSQPENCSRYK